MLRWYDATLAGDVTVGDAPSGIAFDGQNLWVIQTGSRTLTKLRPSDATVLATFDLGAGATEGNSITFDGLNLWVSTQDSHVRKVRATDGSVLGAYALGGMAAAIAYDGTEIWAAGHANDSLMQLQPKSNNLVAALALPAGSAPAGVAFDGVSMWVTHHGTNTVSKVRISDNTIIATFGAGTNPSGIAFDGANMWVVNSGANSVIKLTSSGQVAQTVAVGQHPMSIAFDGNNMWVTNQASNNVTKIRVGDGVVLGTYPVGAGPTGIAFDGANIWVANTGGKHRRNDRGGGNNSLQPALAVRGLRTRERYSRGFAVLWILH
jgi:outer membrane lipoprotein-sorting protein